MKRKNIHLFRAETTPSLLTYDGEYDEPLEGGPPHEPHGGPPDGVGPAQQEERGGELALPLLAGHGAVLAGHPGDDRRPREPGVICF